jgi:hypothetical protein
MDKEIKKGGWQVNVEYFGDYVIKTPKTEKEIIIEVERYLIRKDNLEELDKRVKEMQEDWKTSLLLIKQKKIPLRLLGYPEFLNNGKIKQKRALILEDIFNNLKRENKIQEIERIIIKTLDLILELWKYGIVEKTSKIGQEMGIVNDEVILVDFGELSNRKDIAEKQILKKKWHKNLKEYCGQELADLFIKLAENKLTLETLNKVWDSKNQNI